MLIYLNSNSKINTKLVNYYIFSAEKIPVTFNSAIFLNILEKRDIAKKQLFIAWIIIIIMLDIIIIIGPKF